MVFIVQRNQRLKLTCILALFRDMYFSGARLGRKDDGKTSDLTPSTPTPHCAWLLSGSKHSNVWAIEWTSFKIRHSYLFHHHTTKVYTVSILHMGVGTTHIYTQQQQQWLGTQAGLVFRKGCTIGVWPTRCGISKFIGSEMWFLSSSLVFEPARPTT